MTTAPVLHAFVIPVDEAYFVQSLELNYAAQGSDAPHAMKNFLVGIKATAIVQAQEREADPSLPEGLLKPSPERAWKEFERLTRSAGVYSEVRSLDSAVPRFDTVMFMVELPRHDDRESSFEPTTKLLHAYVIPDDNALCMQGLEINHFSQGKSVEDAITGFLETLKETAKMHLIEHRSLNALLEPAPEESWSEFDAILREPHTRVWLRPIASPAALLFHTVLILERVIE